MGPSQGQLIFARPPWMQDKDAFDCSLCHAEFTSFNRRHHCRHCGQIFCGTHCSNKIALPQLGYDTKERVCDDCIEVANLIANAVSESPSLQCLGAAGLMELANKEHGPPKLVRFGGLGALINMCSSSSDDVLLAATTSIESLARIEELQNAMVDKNVLSSLFNICLSPSIKKPAIIANTARTLFYLAKNVDVCERVSSESGLQALLAVAQKEMPNSADAAQLKVVQALGARTIAYLTMHEKNQMRIIDDRKGALEMLTSLLLNSNNEDVRKYVAKSLAYLSLRNDKSKAKILRGNGIQALVKTLRNDTVRETLSHVACTIANLATNQESQELMMSNKDILVSLCRLTETASDRSDILRHVARGLANFALYETNQDVMISTALPAILRLGQTRVPETQRHVVRAIDNILSNAPGRIIRVLRDCGIKEILTAFVSTQTVPENADMIKRASAALAQFEAAVEDDKQEGEKDGRNNQQAGAQSSASINRRRVPNNDLMTQRAPTTSIDISQQDIKLDQHKSEFDGLQEDLMMSDLQDA